jgi:hypothetical protein
MKGGMFLLALCLSWMACTNRSAIPSGIIARDSMQAILRDVVLTDQFATQFLLKDSLRKDSTHRNVKAETLQLYETVFKLHHTTREEFLKSLNFYYSRPDLMKNILDSMVAYENRHREELYRPQTSAAGSPAQDSSSAHARDSLNLHKRTP